MLFWTRNTETDRQTDRDREYHVNTMCTDESDKTSNHTSIIITVIASYTKCIINSSRCYLANIISDQFVNM